MMLRDLFEKEREMRERERDNLALRRLVRSRASFGLTKFLPLCVADTGHEALCFRVSETDVSNLMIEGLKL